WGIRTVVCGVRGRAGYNGGKRRRLQNPLFISILVPAANGGRLTQTPRSLVDLWSRAGRGGIMAGTVKPARLESQSARARLKRGPQPHSKAPVEGQERLGFPIC